MHNVIVGIAYEPNCLWAHRNGVRPANLKPEFTQHQHAIGQNCISGDRGTESPFERSVSAVSPNTNQLGRFEGRNRMSRLVRVCHNFLSRS